MRIRPTYLNYGVQALIWASLLFIPLLFFYKVADSTGLPAYFYFFANLYHIALFYANAFVLYPRLFTKKLWWSYLLVLGAIIALSYYGKVYLLHFFWPSLELTAYNTRIIFFPPIAFLLAAVFYRLIKDRIEFDKMEKERKAARMASELKFLRSQISPHFLFNMMTNMVSLSRQKSDLLEPSLLKLSDLLRYMLYESGKEKILIGDEINYLRSYIELQQMRFGEDTDLQLEINDDNSCCSIEPMLLVPFVENAFKHGIGIVKDPFIKIRMETADGQLLFDVSNNYSSQAFSKDKSSGIGLENVKTRLDLLYPGKYKLVVDDNGSIYSVKLNLILTC